MYANEFVAYNSANESTFQTLFLPLEFREGLFAINDFVDLLQYIVDNVGSILYSMSCPESLLLPHRLSTDSPTLSTTPFQSTPWGATLSCSTQLPTK